MRIKDYVGADFKTTLYYIQRRKMSTYPGMSSRTQAADAGSNFTNVMLRFTQKGKNPMGNHRMICAISLLIVFTSTLIAQQKKFTFDQISDRRESSVLGRLPAIDGWFDGDHYLSRLTDQKQGTDILYKVRARDGKATTLVDYIALNQNLPQGFEVQSAETHTSDYKQFIWSQNNDLYYYSVNENQFQKLTDDSLDEKNATFSPDGKHIAFTRANDLYVINLASGAETKLTSDGSDVVYNGWASWVYYEEILGRSSKYKAFWWSPDGKMITFLRTDEVNVPQFPLFRADGVHGELEMQRYPKSGDPLPLVRLGVVFIGSGKTLWCDVDENPDHYIAWPFWTPDSKELFFQWMNRGQDTIRIYSLGLPSGTIRRVYEENQPAWVEFFEDIYVLEDNTGFILRSDKSGWYHLYHYAMDGSLIRQITAGEWPVSKILRIDEKNSLIFFSGWQKHSTETHLFSVDFDGRSVRRLTSEPGTHDCTVSPTGSFILDEFSDMTQPARLVMRKRNGEIVREIGNRKLAQLDEYTLGIGEIFTIRGGSGIDFPAMWILPADFDSTQRYPVLLSVYGGPGRSSVRNSFPRLSHHFQAQNGIITMMIDHRGSGHFGKKGASQMHRNLGKYEIEDLAEGVRWLRRHSFIDSTKIGITGGSYGGYVVCMAMTAGADYFTHGAAHYSVTDWLLYDAVYTERYMDTPSENPDGYKYASALTHSEKYKGGLLITHGSMDDNVHMQNTIQFIERLQDLNRDFAVMIYPNSRHGIGYPKYNHFARETMKFWFGNLLGRGFDPQSDL